MPIESASMQRAKQDSKLSASAENKKGGVLSSAQLASLLWRRWKCHLSAFGMDGVTFEVSKPPAVIANRADDDSKFNDDSKFKRNADSTKECYYASLDVHYEYQATGNHWTACVRVCVLDNVYVDLN